MECPIQSRDNADLLLAYCARKLEPETAAVLERHIEFCPECREFAAGQRLVWSALDAWEDQPATPDFDRRLFDRIEFEERRGFWGRVVRPWLPAQFKPAFPLAAASVLVAAVLLLKTPAPPEYTQSTAVEAVDAERIEKTLEDLEMLRQLNLLASTEPAVSPSAM